MTQVPIEYPLGGVSDVVSRSAQPSNTTPHELNMRVYDPISGRAQGSQRAGYERYVDQPVVGGSRVKHLSVVARANKTVNYENIDTLTDKPLPIWGRGRKNGGAGYDVIVDDQCNVYALDGGTHMRKYNPDGNLVAQLNLPVDNISPAPTNPYICRTIAINNEDDSLYMGVTAGGDGDPSQSEVWCFDQIEDDEFDLRWRMAMHDNGSNGQYVIRLRVVGNLLYILSRRINSETQSRIQVQHSLNVSSGERIRNDFTLWDHFFNESDANDMGVTPDGHVVVCRKGSTPSNGQLQKVGPEGVAWTVTNDGMELGCVVASDGSIFSVGSSDSGSSQPTIIRHILDNGTSAQVNGGDAWRFTPNVGSPNATYTGQFPRLAVDQFDNVYVPVHIEDAGGPIPAQPYMYGLTRESNGANLPKAFICQYLPPDAVNNPVRAHAVAIDPDVPNYDRVYRETEGPNDTDNPRTRHVYLGRRREGTSSGIDKLSLVNVTPITGVRDRTHTIVAIGGGAVGVRQSVRVLDTEDSTWSIPAGGSGRFSFNARYISSVQAFGKWFATDGIRPYIVYDPEPGVGQSLIRGEVEELLSKTGCAIPKNYQLVTVWQSRIVWARSKDNPYRLTMSAQGDPFDYDENPALITAKTAVSANSPSLGLSNTPADVINSVYPWSDDLLFVGGDHSLTRITGNPRQGGQLDLVSSSVGTTFGPCWSRDEQGVAYFSGSSKGRISIFKVVPGAQPVSISGGDKYIDGRLNDINLGNFYFHLEWDGKQRGLAVYVIPYAESSSDVTHYFWEKDVDAWHPDTFTSLTNQPASVSILDGDNSRDRALLVGGHDGYVRNVSATAKSDDGDRILSEVVIGPLGGKNAGQNIRFYNPRPVLDHKKDGIQLELLSGNLPDHNLASSTSGWAQPGDNDGIPLRAKGRYVWIRMANGREGQSWGFESMMVDAVRAGKKRRLV